jgi:hypothetical protein
MASVARARTGLKFTYNACAWAITRCDIPGALGDLFGTRMTATQWCRRLVVALLLLAVQPRAWAWHPDGGDAAIIGADLAVAWLAITGPPPAEPARDELAASFGSFNVRENEGSTPIYGVEYRFGGRRFWNGQPIVGVGETAQDSKYGYAGLRFGLPVGPRLELTSDFALAAYSRGHGKNLGTAKEFYFSLGVDYRFADDARAGLAIRHISHDDLVTTYDPGVDIVVLTLSFLVR